MMLRWFSRSKGIQVQIVNSHQQYFSSSSSSDGPPSAPPAAHPERCSTNRARNPFEEEEKAEAKHVLDMLATSKKNADDKRAGYLKQEQDATSSYDSLKKLYLEQNLNKYDSQAIGKNLDDETPFERIVRVVKADFTWPSFQKFFSPEDISQYGTSDFLIIGSGISASLLGYYLKAEVPKLDITVVEEDPLIACEPLGINGEGLTMQWDMPHYIKMANFGFNFYRALPEELHKKDANLRFTPFGSLFLSNSSEDLDGRCSMYDTIDWQYERLNRVRLSKAFPWLNLDGVQEGTHGLRSEGWIDPWAALAYCRRLAISSGVHFMKGVLTDVIFNQELHVAAEDRDYGEIDRPKIAVVKLPDGRGETIDFSNIVLASGLRNRYNSLKLHIGNGPGYLRVPLPLKMKKRYMFRLRCFDSPVVDFPLIMDPSGFRIRREGFAGRYLCWRDPSKEEEPSVDSLDVDMSYFEEKIRPALVSRIPSFKNAQVESCWAGFIDANEYDGEPIIGQHPSYGNVFLVTGLGSKELVLSPAIAKASAEIILESEYKTVDCSAFLLDRVIFDDPIKKTARM